MRMDLTTFSGTESNLQSDRWPLSHRRSPTPSKGS
jgi:hypothetical protein